MNTNAAIEVSGVRKGFGDTEVLRDVDLTVRPGAVVALLGSSGCGKTTLLRTIAGLERADAGEVRVDGRVVSGPSIHVPPERRRVGMVFQDWALFPHMTVAQNVGYGLRGRAAGRGRHPAGARGGRTSDPGGDRNGDRVVEALAMVGMTGLGDRHPATLSGGQQQRVALARALAPQPGVLLLDEPFSNLDSTLRVQVRSEVHQLLAELDIATVFVTHDQEEAFVLGDEVAVINDGCVVQQATPADLYARPATRWVATFVGDANLVPGDAFGHVADTFLGRVPLEGAIDGRVDVLLRPEELRLGPADGGGAAATVEVFEYYGHDTVYVVRPDAGDVVRVRVGSAPRHRRGDRVGVRYGGRPALAYAVRTADGRDGCDDRPDEMPGGTAESGCPADRPRPTVAVGGDRVRSG